MYGMTNVAEREAAAAAVLLPVQQASLLFLQSHLSLHQGLQTWSDLGHSAYSIWL